MDVTVIATRFDSVDGRLESLDRRLANIEQILPTLASKAELGDLATTIDRELATKGELRNLATKDGLEELRRHMSILNEAVRSDIQLLAEHLASDRPKPRKG